MQKFIRKFKSFEEADEAERRDYAALSIQQRIDITMELVSWMDPTAWRSLVCNWERASAFSHTHGSDRPRFCNCLTEQRPRSAVRRVRPSIVAVRSSIK